jgi:hypothetical protein
MDFFSGVKGMLEVNKDPYSTPYHQIKHNHHEIQKLPVYQHMVACNLFVMFQT